MSNRKQLIYLRNNELRAEIVRAVGSDPSRYETAESARGLCKADLVRITETVTSRDEASELTLRELYNTLDAAVSGMDHSHNAGNTWGIRREDLEALHRAVHDESQLVTDGGQCTDETERAVDKSDSDHTGSPKRMSATCVECGERSVGGCVAVWFDIVDGRSVPRDDVSFLCPGCDEVTEQKIEILKRRPGVGRDV